MQTFAIIDKEDKVESGISVVATIKDVAKLANVAPSTVSRVIADNPRISEKTKKRVREVMKEIGYHPNMIARSLVNQSTNVIGLVMPGSADVFFQNPFFPNVLRGLSESAHKKKYAIQMTTGQTENEILDDVMQMVHGRRVDGLIILQAKRKDKIIEFLLQQKFPFVVIGKPAEYIDEISHVDNDNIKAMKEATEYLLDLGHKEIAFIGGKSDLIVTMDRLQGYKTALAHADVKMNKEFIVHEEFLLEGGKEAISELLKLSSPPTALVVADDLMALGVLNTLSDLGVSVPNDMSVISFNNVLLAEMANPPLSSVDINIFDLGYEAAKHVILQIENKKEPIKRIIIPHSIVSRHSCSPIE